MISMKMSHNFISTMGVICGVTIAGAIALTNDFQAKNLFVGMIAGGVLGFMFSQMVPNKDDHQGCQCGHSHDNLAKSWDDI